MKSLRTGTFIYPKYGNEVIIKRTKTKQIESYDNGKSKIYMSIEWPADDQYVLTFVKIKSEDKGDMKGHKLYVSIISCDNGTYQYHCKSDIYGDSDSSIQKIK